MRTIPAAVSAPLARVSALCVAVSAFGVAVSALCVAVLAFGALPAAHAGQSEANVVAAHAVVVSSGPVHAQESGTDSSSGSSPSSTLPPGPRIDPKESQQATENKAQTKAVIGAVAACLLVIVILGRRHRNKHKPGGKG